jgi:hypothetical protein
MKRLFLTAMLAAAALASVSAQAAIVEVGPSMAAPDGSGKTTQLLGRSNIRVETFDQYDPVTNARTCGLAQTGASFVGGPVSFVSGTVPGAHAAPAGDSTCFAYGPGVTDPIFNAPGNTPPEAGTGPGQYPFIDKPILASITIDYLGLINDPTAANGSYLNYFGLYYGSIDRYNLIEFMRADGSVIDYVSGDEMMSSPAFAGCAPGDQTAACSNQYVNIFLDAADGFQQIRFTTWGVAVEVDNLAVGWNVAPTDIPEPASLALLGVGLAALGLSRRRKATTN